MSVKTSFFLLLLSVLFVIHGCENPGASNKTINREEIVSPLKDVDGNVYKTVNIGGRVWMAENLKVTKYRNGDPIPHVSDEAEWSKVSLGAYCNYSNDTSVASIYGRLYNWHAINDKRNIAPEGWHIPTPEELRSLMSHLGGDTIAGGKMKVEGISHWLYPNAGASNESGFSALPGGYRFGKGSYHTLGSNAYWWTTQNSYEIYSWKSLLHEGFADVRRDYGYTNFGLAVRCVKD